ncbi:hypothetical protein ACFQV2_24270 [Actinokineospora soli]|uniref:Uncharacterized protein n=1 Tax=Actinokineospora soli TaxID=1048753 RepID=A0ABW2TSZ8_9PSEU
MDSTHNEMHVTGSVVGPVIMARTVGKVNSKITHTATAPVDLADRIDEVTRLVTVHANRVPRQAMTKACLEQIAEGVRHPTPETPSLVGSLWRDLAPNSASWPIRSGSSPR